MRFASILEVRLLCERIAAGAFLDVDALIADGKAIQLLISEEQKRALPVGFLPLLDSITQLHQETAARLLVAEQTNRTLGQAVAFLASEIGRLTGDSDT